MPVAVHTEGGEPFGRYRLLERIGAGGMAVVYRAVGPSTDGKAMRVIKRVRPELSRDPAFVRMLIAEARLSSRLVHPGIVAMHELGRVGDEYFLAMEHVDGLDLVHLFNRCISTRQTMPIGVICHIVASVAAALAYAHALKDAEGRPLEIVHRDVSPANVMVTLDGQVKLLDFGVAKAAEHVRDDRTRTGTLKGKINYLSPEQAEGLAIDHRSDLFALGIVLHECLTLRRLFRGPNDLTTLRLVRQCEVAPPSTLRPDVPAELDTIALRMLARDPKQRYADGDEIVAALAPLVAAHDGSAERLAHFLAMLPEAPVEKAPVEREETMDLGLKPAAPAYEPSFADDESEPSIIVESQEEPPAPAPTPPSPAPRHSRARSVATLLLLAGGVVGAADLARRSTRTLPEPPAVVIVQPPAPSPPPPPAPAPPPPAPPPIVGHVVIDVDASGAQIVFDGKVVPATGRHARVAVDRTGEHFVAVTAPRRKPYVRSVVVGHGGDVRLKVRLERARAAEHYKVRTPDGDYLVDPFGDKKK